jgi:hypothetical protein
MFEVFDNVIQPPPARSKAGAYRKYPLDELKVGQMFFVPHGSGPSRKSLATHVSVEAKKLGRKFSTRDVALLTSSKGPPKIVAAGTPGAVRGIAVWRTA